ncbi:vWA domain-containing protein [Myxococcus sp. CA040A]|uniref:vWA domain-containing protein n=1 Tax=Myxococcus sp. CA040A TaxID=2741738 RepID=UPI00157B5FE2|nr:vWA domain-containing protein [Myxococcus sp. CA040A]NTX01785.1 VWA domain-containing protein [Myxococcus sp. CA040A]
MPRHSKRLSWLAVPFLLGAPASLAATHELDISAPATTIPITRVKVMLESSTPIPNGATLTFATPTGDKDVTVGGGPTPLGDPLTGDQVVITGGGTNAILIDYKRRDLLLLVGDLCSIKPPQDGSGKIRFTPDATNFNNLTGYRTTSFAAPSLSQCECSSRRVKGLTLWTQPPPGVDRGRIPMDVALVLDRSGSMLSTTPGDPANVEKWLALQSAAEQFIHFWEVEGLDPLSQTGGTGLGKDRLALVYFESDSEPTQFNGKLFVERAPALMDGGHPWEQAVSHVNANVTAGTTAMGGGIRDALTAWQADMVNDLTLVVMTDGMQNVNPMVKDGTGGDTGFKVLEVAPGAAERLTRHCVPMLTVAVASGAVPYADLMNAISQQTAGQSHLTTSSGTTTAFAQQLVTALKGNTLSTLLQSSTTLPSGTNTASRSVDVDGTVQSLYVNLGWFTTSPRGQPVTLKVTAPDGSNPKPVAVKTGRSHVLNRYDFPKAGPVGKWQLTVNRIPGTASPAIPYQLGAYVQEKSLDFQLSLDRLRHSAGQPLNVVAQVSFDGKPLENLNNGELTVLVETPNGALGTLMHETRGEGRGEQSPDPVSPYQGKLDTLMKDPEFLKKMGTTVGKDELVLKETAPGIYKLEFKDTQTPGTYRFHFQLLMKGPSGEPLRRTEIVETQVDVLPSGSKTDVQVTRVDTGSYVLVLTPRDALGNYVGPGFEDRVVVQINGKGRQAPATTPKLDGTYEVRLSGIAEGTEIIVLVNGTPVAKGPVTKLEPVEPRPPDNGTGRDGGTGGGDGGSGPPVPPPGEGCPCKHTRPSGSTGVLGLVALGFLASRRRKHHDGD